MQVAERCRIGAAARGHVMASLGDASECLTIKIEATTQKAAAHWASSIGIRGGPLPGVSEPGLSPIRERDSCAENALMGQLLLLVWTGGLTVGSPAAFHPAMPSAITLTLV
jgi:hypothetical protein